MSGETARSDFYGIVLNAAVAAMDGCPWIEKGRVAEIADGVAEAVTERLSEVESVELPTGQQFESTPACCSRVDEPRICHCHAHWHPHRKAAGCGPNARPTWATTRESRADG